MNILENMVNSISGSVDKAILCVKKPVLSNKEECGYSVKDSTSAIDLQAKLMAIKKDGMFSFSSQAQNLAKQSGYHVLKVKYNPSKIRLDSRAGSMIRSGPGGEGTNTLSQVVVPAETYMSFELIFDEENHQDAFMFDKFTNVSAGALVSDVSSAVKNGAKGGYSVKEEVEAMIGMLTQSETREIVFYWSEMVFAGELVSLDAKYTMFNTLGNPIRAVVGVTIRESEDNVKKTNGAYWEKSFNTLMRKGSVLQEKATSVLNLR